MCGIHFLKWILLFSTNIINNVEGQCDGSTLFLNTTEEPTNIETPNYPNGYANELNCMWILDSGSDGQRIMLYSDSADVVCNDYFAIYDGNSSSDSELESICGGSSTTDILITSGRYATLVFRTDSSGFGDGLTLTYFSAPDTSGSGCTETVTVLATETPQYLTSENFPDTYSSYSDCRWEIYGSTALSTLYVEVVFMEVEEDSACSYDYVSIYDGASICEFNEMVTTCPTRSNAEASRFNFTSTDNAVMVKLSSDVSVEGHGFVIKYYEYIGVTTTTTGIPTTTTTTTPTTTTPTTTPTTTTTTTTTTAATTTLGTTEACCACTPSTTTSTTTAPPTTTTTTTTQAAPTTTVTEAASTTTPDNTSISCPTNSNTTADKNSDEGLNIPVLAGSAAAGAALGASVVGAIWLIQHLRVRNALPSSVTKVEPASNPVADQSASRSRVTDQTGNLRSQSGLKTGARTILPK